jgi:arylsulfatase A-like enzyme
MSRRQFAGGVLSAAAAAEMLPVRSKASSRPNIIFILADDLGWGDLSCYGRPDYKTPNLDKLAAGGMRFTNAYSAAPVCTPTRIGFHTGRYPARLPIGLEEPLKERKQIGEAVNTLGIPVSHPTVSSLLKKAGYRTALIGKWHCGYLPHFGPIKHGYDEFFGIMSGAGDLFTHRDMTGTPDLFEGEVPIDRAGYITDLLTDRAVEYIQKKHTQPFYLSLHHTAPHWPWEGPSDIAISKTLGKGYDAFTSGGSLKIYAEMMRSLDQGIGRLMEALKRSGQDRNTVVIFTSDNGGERFSFNWPFTGQKFDVQEGGIRVPAMVRWHGVTSAGAVSDQPVITMDWTATLLSIAGTSPDAAYPLDGEDLTSVLSGKRPPFERTFFWRTYKQAAVRSGKWKYIRQADGEYLHDLSVDEREQANFASVQPDVFARLRSAVNDWESKMQKYPKDA